MKRAIIVFCTATMLLACRAEPQTNASQSIDRRPAAAPSVSERGRPQTGLERIPLIIRSGDQTHRFTVEVAATEKQQAIGMMFRESIGPTEGMLFPYPTPRPLTFWMQNTLIPLDIIFIRADGSIARIVENATPLSLAQIESGEPAIAVLELAGGRAADLGIRVGDQVTWSR